MQEPGRARRNRRRASMHHFGGMTQASTPEFERLLEYLKQTRGFDFTAYKRSTLARRINKRRQAVRAATYTDYLDYLEVHPDEFAQLFNTILINVTSFFRDAPAWDYVRDEIVPRLLDLKPDGEVFRVWCAACASGEEAYTVAMLLAEQLGEEQFRHRVKIYATDVDEEALNEARFAAYTPAQMEGLSAERLARFFQPADGRHVFRAELRRALPQFGRREERWRADRRRGVRIQLRRWALPRPPAAGRGAGAVRVRAG